MSHDTGHPAGPGDPRLDDEPIVLVKAGLPAGGVAPTYPLGIMSIASYLRERGVQHVSLIDPRAPGVVDRMSDELRARRPRIVGLSALTVEKAHLDHLVALVRAALPDALIVVGGPYPSASWRGALDDPRVDLAVIGEGEATFAEIVHRVQRGLPLVGIAGTAYRAESGGVVQGPPRAALMDVESLPDPAWDLVDLDFHARSTSMGPLPPRRYMSLFSSRACPFECNYCHDLFGRTFRAQSAERMVQQIETVIARYGIRDFEFLDDIWNLDKERVRRFCRLVIERGLDVAIQFPNGVRADMLDREQLELMRRAGTFYMCFAIESASPEIQKQIKKRNRLDRIRENIRIADELGFLVTGFFMVGFPQETFRQMLRTAWFMVSSRLTLAYLFVVTPFEGTAVYEQVDEAQRAQSFGTNEFFYAKTNLAGVPPWLFRGLITATNVLFYGNPVRLAKIVRRYPRKRYLLREGWKFVTRSLLRVNLEDRPPLLASMRKLFGRPTAGGTSASRPRPALDRA